MGKSCDCKRGWPPEVFFKIEKGFAFDVNKLMLVGIKTDESTFEPFAGTEYSLMKVDELFLYVEHNGLIGLMDWNLNWITEPEYERIERFYDGYAFAVKDGVEVILDTNGTVIVEDIGRFRKIRPKTVLLIALT
jgi:hypothetical protein